MTDATGRGTIALDVVTDDVDDEMIEVELDLDDPDLIAFHRDRESSLRARARARLNYELYSALEDLTEDEARTLQEPLSATDKRTVSCLKFALAFLSTGNVRESCRAAGVKVDQAEGYRMLANPIVERFLRIRMPDSVVQALGEASIRNAIWAVEEFKRSLDRLSSMVIGKSENPFEYGERDLQKALGEFADVCRRVIEFTGLSKQKVPSESNGSGNGASSFTVWMQNVILKAENEKEKIKDGRFVVDPRGDRSLPLRPPGGVAPLGASRPQGEEAVGGD